MQGEAKYFVVTVAGGGVELTVTDGKIEVPAGLAKLEAGVLSDLARVGLLSLDRGSGVHKMRIVDESLNLFLPLLEHHRVRLRPMERDGCPVRFCTGLLTESTADEASGVSPARPIPAGGQGDFEKNAALSCLGELAERLSLCSLGVHDPRVFTVENEQPEVDFAPLLGLSGAQCVAAGRALGMPAAGAAASTPQWEVLSDRRIRLRNLADGQLAQFPSFGVLFQESEHTIKGALSFASSAGCAVWPTREGARKRALLELVERDAIAQAWYNRLGITFVEAGSVRELSPDPLVAYMNARSRRWGLFLVDTDLPVQVAMAVSYEEGGRRCAFGSSAGWTLETAGKSALEELLQAENSLVLMEKAYRTDREKGEGPRQLTYARTGSILEDLPVESAPRATNLPGRGGSGYENLLQACLDRNLTIWEFDATRADLNIPCIKLMSPDLCTWEPRFGKERLYRGVVERGLRHRPATEAEFAARPFPF